MSLALVINAGQVQRVGATTTPEPLLVREGVGAGIDVVAAGALEIGVTTANGITIGSGGAGGVLTTIGGDLQVDGNETVVGSTTFQGNTTIGDATSDTLEVLSQVINNTSGVTNESLGFDQTTPHLVHVRQAAAEVAGTNLTIESGEGGDTAGVAKGGDAGSLTVSAAKGGDGDGANFAGVGGTINVTGGDAGVDNGGGGNDAGDVSVQGGSGTGAGRDGIINIGTVTAETINVGAVGNPTILFHEKESGVTADAEVALSTSATSGTSTSVGSFAIGVDSGNLTNSTPGNPDLQTTIEALDAAIGAGGASLQTAYDNGPTVTLDATGAIEITDSGTNADGNSFTVSSAETGGRDVVVFTKNPGSADGGGQVLVLENNDNSQGELLRLINTTGGDFTDIDESLLSYDNSANPTGGFGIFVVAKTATSTGGDGISLDAGKGGVASGATAGSGGTLLAEAGAGGDSDGTDLAGTGGSTVVEGGDGGAGSGTVVGGTGGTLTVNGGVGGTDSGTGGPGAGGDASLLGGDAAADGGSGAAANGGGVSIQGGSPTNAGTAGAISIGTTTGSGITVGASTIGTNLFHNAEAGAPGDAIVQLNVSATSGTATGVGSFAIGVDTGDLTNSTPGNPDLQTTLEALDTAIGAGGASLQTAYDNGPTVTLDATGAIEITDATTNVDGNAFTVSSDFDNDDNRDVVVFSKQPGTSDGGHVLLLQNNTNATAAAVRAINTTNSRFYDWDQGAATFDNSGNAQSTYLYSAVTKTVAQEQGDGWRWDAGQGGVASGGSTAGFGGPFVANAGTGGSGTANAGETGGLGGSLTVNAGTGGADGGVGAGTGGTAVVNGGDGGASAAGGSPGGGGRVEVFGGSAGADTGGTGANANGGDIDIRGGTAVNNGSPGAIDVGVSTTSAVTVGSTSADPTVDIATASSAINITSTVGGTQTAGTITIQSDSTATGATAGNIAIQTVSSGSGTSGGVTIRSGGTVGLAPSAGAIDVIATGDVTVDLTESTGSFLVDATVTGGVTGGSITLLTDDGDGTTTSGDIAVHALASGGGTSGGLSLKAGGSAPLAPASGEINITAGADLNASTSTGALSATSSVGGTSTAGNVELSSDATASGATAGDVLIGSISSGNGTVGGVQIRGGGTGFTAATGGAVQIEASGTIGIGTEDATIQIGTSGGAGDISVLSGTGSISITNSVGGTDTAGNIEMSSDANASGATAGDVLVASFSSGNGTSGGVLIQAGGTAIGAATSNQVDVVASGNIVFDALGMTDPIELNESGDLDLDGSFTATSIIGALNELKSGTGTGVTTIQATTGEAIAAGAPVSMDDDGGGNPVALEGDADGTNERPNVFGLALSAASLGATVDIVVAGEVDVPDAQWDSIPAPTDVGKTVFVSTTVGNLTLTAPSNQGDTVKRVGIVTRGGTGAVKVAVPMGNDTLL